jgi:hypothetical protein
MWAPIISYPILMREVIPIKREINNTVQSSAMVHYKGGMELYPHPLHTPSSYGA